MYICRDCGEIFTEDELEEEDCSFYTEYWGSDILVPYTDYKCPYCGSKDFVNACRCENCGEWCDPDDEGLCDGCGKELSRDISTTYIYGPPGVGKTRSVIDRFGDKVFVAQCWDNRSLMGYEDQEVILLDDFTSLCDINYVIKVLDGDPLKIPYKKELKETVYDRVYIISTKPLSEQHTNIQNNNPDLYKEFLRKIHNVIRIDQNGAKFVEKGRLFI